MSLSRTTWAAFVLTIAWLMAYGATVFGGFVRDDFGWVYHSRLTGWDSIPALFAGSHLFYRPIVQLSFGVTEWVFGANPIPYALTNLLLGMACAAAVFVLARALGLASWAALLAASLWAFNFHGINMAIIWLSGRTSLLGALFSTLAALAVVRRRTITAGFLGFAAFLSKEEVLALPLILTIWLIIDGVSIKRSFGLWIALAVYFPLRNQSGAVGITDAPPYYQFVFDPMHVLRNIVEYADRSSTLAVLVTIAAVMAFARLPQLDTDDGRLIVKGLVWLAGGFAATIWLPVRSSLYAVFPSIGAVLVAAVVVAAIARANDARATRLAIAACVLPFLLLPVYWQRNVRWTELRHLSTETIRAINSDRPTGPALVVLHDDLTTRANFRHVFAGLLVEASAVHFGNSVSLWIEPPPPEVDPAARPAINGRTVSFRLVDGRVEPVRIIDVGN